MGNMSGAWVEAGGSASVLDELTDVSPLVTALAAIVAPTLGVATIRQRSTADRRHQWWKRAQWALDLCLDVNEDDDRASVGFAVLQVLAESALATKDELRVLEAAWNVWLVRPPGTPDESEGPDAAPA
jgi:hypothetical protein